MLTNALSFTLSFSGLCAGLAIIVASSALAQTAQIVPADKLKTVEQDLALTAQRKSAIELEVTALIAADEFMSSKLVVLAKQIGSQQNDLASAQAKLEELKKEEIVIVSGLAAKREVLSELLAGLQLLEQNPPPALIVNPDDILGALRSAMVFGAVVPELKEEAIKLTNQLQRLKDVKLQLDVAQETANNQLKALAVAEEDLQSLRSEKQILISSSKLALSTEDANLVTLTSKATTLRDLLAALATSQRMEENRRSAEAAEALRVAALKASPMMRLASAKGRLNYPIAGEIIRKFGEDNGLGALMTGIALAGLSDSLVTSPVDGKVQYAGPFRSLHQLVILDVSDNMTILLGGFDHIDVRIGQIVRAGEPLGRLGRKSNVTAFMDTGLGGDKPLLYVEFRNKGEPIDSTPWWTGAQQEAKSK